MSRGTDDLPGLHRRASADFDRRVQAIRPDHWERPTPCADWDVRALVRHLVYEALWTPALFAGSTVAEVGDRFEGDILGGDAVKAWEEAKGPAHEAVAAPGAMERTVHLSYADVPGSEYATQLIFDLAVHGWDLARGIGVDDAIDGDVAAFCLEWLEPNLEPMAGSGLFATPVEVGPDASLQDRLLAMTGRQP